MRVGIISILQESNTFIQGKTTLRDFQNDILSEGDSICQKFQNSHHEIGGFFKGLQKQGIEAVPLLAARALPYGVIESDCWNYLMGRMDKVLKGAGHLDGILAAPHGATVAENEPDADGFWLRKLRSAMGDKPIVATADPHGNLSQKQSDSVNAILSYRTNPHMDPTKATAYLPFAVNIFCQNSSEDPFKGFISIVESIRNKPKVLAVSVFVGFPYADVPQMGAAICVMTNNDFALAKKYTDELAQHWLSLKKQFDPILPSVADSVTQMKYLLGPICALDMGDNVGGGSPGDSTILVHELIAQKAFPFFTVIADPEIVVQATSIGIGNSASFTIGAKHDRFHGLPLLLNAKVSFLGEGKFSESSPTHGGFTEFDQGKTAILHTEEGNTLMITSRRMVPFSLNQLLSFGIDPKQYRVLVVKGVHAPLAAYKAVCKSIVRVDTPGVTSASLNRLPYKMRRKPMFPFEVC
ncbi:MAG: M81 family metallopeptidase [Planctomycetota bacterium]|nr:M81 family metallopeptidase [Planctomycetota bacterium]